MPAVLARELAHRGHSVRVLTGYPNFPDGRLYGGYRMELRRDGIVSGIPVRRVALFPSHGPSILGRLANYGTFAASASLWGASWFKDVEALWVSNSPPTVGLPTWLIQARYRPRIVMHIMDLWPESLQAGGFGRPVERWRLLRSALDRWLSMTYEVADSIACTSRTQIELLGQRGVPAHKLSYVPIWVDETIFHPMARDEKLAARLGIEAKTVLLYAGALGEPQGLEPLVEACRRLQNDPSFHCIIAGTGTAESRLRDQAGDVSNISFLGHWPVNDMTRLMSVGDVHFVSLRPNPIAEIAMPSKIPATLACGKPLIVAAMGEAAGVVERSGAGWTSVPGDLDQLESTIRASLAAGASRLDSMGQRARAIYERDFSVDQGVARVERLLAGERVRDLNAP